MRVLIHSQANMYELVEDERGAPFIEWMANDVLRAPERYKHRAGPLVG